MNTEKFGTVLGIAPGGVPVYSSDYSTANAKEFPNRQAYRSFVDGVFMGYKWQCVEFVRRWIYLNSRYVFDDVPMAYDIFRLRNIKKLSDGSQLPIRSFRNGALRPPEAGCFLIWDAVGYFEITGHVAVVTEVGDAYIRIAEQNVDNKMWPPEQTFSRQLSIRKAEDGGYWIEPCLENTSILGWVIQTEDDTYSENIEDIDMGLFSPLVDSIDDTGQSSFAWIDTNDPAGAVYVENAGHSLTGDSAKAHKYICLSDTAFLEFKRATNELHHLFMRATDYVLQDEQLLENFNIPPVLWPQIRLSWDNRKNSMITGRFDFSICENGLKVYEYNADSASCYFEAGRLQAAWAGHFGCTVGRDPGEHLFNCLVQAWRARGIKDIIHIMQDLDVEETYHALYMKEAMEKAGITVKVLKGVADLRWSDGTVVDFEGIPIVRVWKTWAWETVLDQFRAEMEERQASEDIDPDSFPRLVDVLLRPGVLVHEPLWTLIPSNKAILPVMWMLFPDHPYLLNAQYELTDVLRESGYVEKPIAGRSGENIVLSDTTDVLCKTDGRFGNRKRIYQELFSLPKIDQMNVQICTFTVAGTYAGACARVDSSPVIRGGSDVMPLRFVSNDEYDRMKQKRD